MRLLKLTLLLVLCACTHSVYAQRHYVGISALEVNYGLNIFGRNNTNLNLSVSKYRSRTTYWKIGLNYFEKSYNYSYESNTAEVPYDPVEQKDFDKKILGKSQNRFVLAFNKFTIPDDKVFEIEMFERGGGRHMKLSILNEYILSAELLK